MCGLCHLSADNKASTPFNSLTLCLVRETKCLHVFMNSTKRLYLLFLLVTLVDNTVQVLYTGIYHTLVSSNSTGCCENELLYLHYAVCVPEDLLVSVGNAFMRTGSLCKS